MGEDNYGRCVFRLTSLQIGDLQSYLSDLQLFMAPESDRFYILVDNRPWLKDLVSRPAHLWQLMVTKSRLSPFANTRGRKERKVTGELSESNARSESNPSRSPKFKRWLSVIDAAAISRKRALLPVKKLRKSLLLNSKLHRTLYGFIVFEVMWCNVRGINYLNELQTDISLALEVKLMRRWEFESVAQAAVCIYSWFPGTSGERSLLEEHLNFEIGEVFYDAPKHMDEDEGISNYMCDEETASPCLNSSSVYLVSLGNAPLQCGSCKGRNVTELSDDEEDHLIAEVHSETVVSQTANASDCEEVAKASEYRDALLLLRFSDRDLPFKLKDVIMSNLRLLTLLESGLPSWVIFLQSYPGFCHLYRPWMCPLARVLYVLISFVTVLIGFYDLYKNVPVLKATASRLCGPLLDWIETWEMVSRIRYLGTMLFLQNLKKAVKWFLMVTSTTRSFLSFLTQPLVGPFAKLLEILFPFWKVCILVGQSCCSFIWILMEAFWNLVEDVVDIVLQPILFILSVIWSLATTVMYPIIWSLWEIVYAPIRLVLGLSSLVAFLYTSIHESVLDLWRLTSGMFQFASSAEATVSTFEVSLWRSLWNDLFSQVFRAVRSIINGFIAFFTACNRHRLSIYNLVRDFIRRLYPVQRSQAMNPEQRGQMYGSQTRSETREAQLLHVKSIKQR